jgi:23S rRNA (cytosine1962-C5)-methyltransferase
VNKKNYLLIDSGDGQKLEQIGKYRIIRPCPLAIWKSYLPKSTWESADALFSRENRWTFTTKIPPSWNIEIENLNLKISFTDFGHLGIFPEHFSLIKLLEEKISKKKEPNILNLFAYTGTLTLALARKGARVCHLDASVKSVNWAKENSSLNNLTNTPVRYIVDDAMKFVKREVKRRVKYDGIILDPPTFGRGASGQVFKIERDLFPLLSLCKELLSENPLFILLTCHTPGFTPRVLENIFSQVMDFSSSKYFSGELILASSESPFSIPSGSFLIWEPK